MGVSDSGRNTLPAERRENMRGVTEDDGPATEPSVRDFRRKTMKS